MTTVTAGSEPVTAAGLLRLEEDAWGRLVATLADGSTIAGVEPVRAFPWSARNDVIVLLDCSGREVACLSPLESLSDEVRAVLDRVLARREFVPSIERIVKWSHPYPPCEWTALTDRGPVTITIDSDDDIRKLEGQSALVSDASGLRFRIPDISRLDASSRGRLRRLM
jgi:hypothetical protein